MSICLCMIVKDEAPVIARCLKSVMPIIDKYVIVDTGSTDGTQEIIRETMGDIPGEVYERSWISFAANRSEALILARQSGADYSLVIDADDVLECAEIHCMPFTQDAYSIDISLGGLSYQRLQIFSNRKSWFYRGVIHEFPHCDGEWTSAKLDGLTILCGSDGYRRTAEDTSAKDAFTLMNELDNEQDPFMRSRYTFYAAQCLKDAGEWEQAIYYYTERTRQGFYDEERYISYLNIARRAIFKRIDIGLILDALDAAIKLCPKRAEAYYEAAQLCRLNGRFADAYAYAKHGSRLVQPDGLFIETYIYRYAMKDELGIAAFYVGEYSDALNACLDILGTGIAPDEHRDRIVANAKFAAGKMRNPPHGSRNHGK